MEGKTSRIKPMSVGVLALLLIVVAGYIRCNRAYLKWKYVGGDETVIEGALSTGQLSPSQVVALVTNGATEDVRIQALSTVAGSEVFPVPYETQVVEAVVAFADSLPADPKTKAWAVCSIADAARKSGQLEFLPILAKLARDSDPKIRQLVCFAFAGGHHFGDEGMELMIALASDSEAGVRSSAVTALGNLRADAAVPLIISALSDPDMAVRRYAAVSALSLNYNGVDTKSLVPSLCDMLESDSEPEENRVKALSALCWMGHMKADDLKAHVNDRHQKVAELAKEWLENP